MFFPDSADHEPVSGGVADHDVVFGNAGCETRRAAGGVAEKRGRRDADFQGRRLFRDGGGDGHVEGESVHRFRGDFRTASAVGRGVQIEFDGGIVFDMGGLDGFDRFAASGGVVDAVDFGVVGVAFDRSEDERHDVVCLDVFESIDFGEHVLLRVVFDEADFSGFFPVDTVCGGDRFRGDGRGEASGADCRKAGHSECFVHTNSLVKVGKRCFPLLCQ